MRVYYLLYYCAQGAISPFINLFYVSRGLSGAEIGLLGTIGALAGLISAPFWGRLNDNVQKPRRLLQVALSANSLAFFLISQQTVFLYMAIIIGFNALIISGLDPLSSTQALDAAAEADAGFGSIRLWGSMGWALAAPISGWVIQRTSLLSGFYAYGIFMLAGALVLFFVRGTSKKPLQPPGATQPDRLAMRAVMREILKSRELVAIMIASIVLWVGTNGTKFESVYLQQLGASASVIGWVNTIGAVIEMPMMLISDRVMRKRDPAFTLRIGYAVYFLGLSFIIIRPSIATIFIYRAMGGVGLAFYLVSYTNFIARRAPAQQTATVLALFSVTIAGIVNILASPLSGWLFDRVGTYWLYVMAMGGYLIAFLIMTLMVRSRPKTPTLTP